MDKSSPRKATSQKQDTLEKFQEGKCFTKKKRFFTRMAGQELKQTRKPIKEPAPVQAGIFCGSPVSGGSVQLGRPIWCSGENPGRRPLWPDGQQAGGTRWGLQQGARTQRHRHRHRKGSVRLRKGTCEQLRRTSGRRRECVGGKQADPDKQGAA